MTINHATDLGLPALAASAIVLALGYLFEYGHALTVAGLFGPVFGA